jgi:hypothetical protein
LIVSVSTASEINLLRGRYLTAAIEATTGGVLKSSTSRSRTAKKRFADIVNEQEPETPTKKHHFEKKSAKTSVEMEAESRGDLFGDISEASEEILTTPGDYGLEDEA